MMSLSLQVSAKGQYDELLVVKVWWTLTQRAAQLCSKEPNLVLPKLALQ